MFHKIETIIYTENIKRFQYFYYVIQKKKYDANLLTLFCYFKFINLIISNFKIILNIIIP